MPTVRMKSIPKSVRNLLSHLAVWIVKLANTCLSTGFCFATLVPPLMIGTVGESDVAVDRLELGSLTLQMMIQVLTAHGRTRSRVD